VWCASSSMQPRQRQQQAAMGEVVKVSEEVQKLGSW
jgi:hypothetical protein